MERIATFKFDDMDVSKAEMRKELENFANYLADKYDADIYKIEITNPDQTPPIPIRERQDRYLRLPSSLCFIRYN